MNLAAKVDELLEQCPELFFRDGQVDAYQLARVINQRERKKNPEPSPEQIQAVKNCVSAHNRRTAKESTR